MIIDPKSNVPIYRQIAQQMRSAIDAKIYRGGEALPSLRALAVEIRVNPNTVQRAYEELEREGIVQSRRGLGVFVSERAQQAARGKSERRVEEALRKSVRQALQDEITPARIRELFETTLTDQLAQARRER